MCMTGINEINDNNTILIYPNPATELLYFINEDTQTPITVSVYDMMGRIIMMNKQIQNNQLDIHNLSKGVYIIEVKKEDSVIKRKFIKE